MNKRKIESEIKKEYKVLFVDDSFERFEAFCESLPSTVAHFYWTPTVEKAISLLEEERPTVVCLDHDLGEGNACGCAVVQWVIEHKNRFQQTQFLIHSWNPPAAEQMHKDLVDGGLKSKIKPFVFVNNHID